MFKNPIKKYQSGGVTPEQARQQVVQFIIQKTGATEDQVNGFLDKISGDEKALGEFQQILELASKDDPKGIDMLKQLFGTQSSQFAKKGGKLHDFICKHAKGGVAGCGCKEDGGKVEKAQYGEIVNDSTGKRRVIYHPEGGYAGYVDLTTGKAYNHNDEEMLQPGWYNGKGYPMAHRNATRGNAYEVNTYGRIIENLPEGNQRVLPPADSANFAELVKQWDMSKIGPAVTAEQNGGEIKNLQVIPKETIVKLESLMQPNYIPNLPENKDTVDKPNIVTIPNLELNYRKIETLPYLDSRPSYFHEPKGDELDNKPNYLNKNKKVNIQLLKKENGGVVKGQKGITVSGEQVYSGEIRPDSVTNPIRKWINRTVDNSSALREASRYARNFGNSAMGKVLDFFVPDISEGIQGAIVPAWKYRIPTQGEIKPVAGPTLVGDKVIKIPKDGIDVQKSSRWDWDYDIDKHYSWGPDSNIYNLLKNKRK